MAAYNILEARNNLSRLIAAVESGAEVTIMRRGKPVARIVPATDADAAQSHTGVDFAAWLAVNPLPTRLARTKEQLDAIIDENRSAWG